MKENGFLLLSLRQDRKRMNLPINKQYLLLGGKPVLAHTLETFQRCLFIDEMIVVVQAEERSYCMENIVQHYGFDKVAAVIPGGAERQESVYKIESCR